MNLLQLLLFVVVTQCVQCGLVMMMMSVITIIAAK